MLAKVFVGLIIGLIVGCFLLLVLYKLYRVTYHRKVKPTRSVKTVKRKAAFSVGGNLVKEYTTIPITEHYEIAKTLLGKGSSAEVVIATHHKTQRRYAVKIIDISNPEIIWRYEREKNYLKDIDHTNVVRLYEVYTSPVALFFVMELCTGGHLGQILKRQTTQWNNLDESTARKYVLQITRAIVHCHKNGICHRDIKLQNILLENNTKDAQIKLIDLGNAFRFKGHCPMTKIVGTSYTIAPEVLRESYDERCDIWSLGVVAYLLLSGRRPFEGFSAPGDPPAVRDACMRASVLKGVFHFKHPAWEEVDYDAIHFVSCCMEQPYEKRMSAGALLDHPWLVNNSNDTASIGASMISDNSAYTLKKSLARNLSSQFAGMRHTSMLAVAFTMPTMKAQQLRTLFQEIDKNGSGTLEKDEFHAAMQQVNPEMSPKDINTLFHTLDLDGNNTISFMEFMAATVDPGEVDMQEMNQAFRLIDKDQKGYITKEDLLRVLETTDDDDLTEAANMAADTVEQDDANNGTYRSRNGSAVTLVHSITHPLSIITSSSASAAATHGQNPHSNRPINGPEATSSSAGNGNIANFSVDGGSDDDGSDVSDGEIMNVMGSAANQARRLRKLTKRIEHIIEAADVNHDGVVSYTEFLFAMAEGTGLTDASSLDALATMPAMVDNNQSSSAGKHRGSVLLPYFNKAKDSSPDKARARRQTDGQYILPGRTFLKRKPTIMTNANNGSGSPNSMVHSGGNPLWNGVISFLSSFLPRSVMWAITTRVGGGDRVELRGKGLAVVSHVDDSPRIADADRDEFDHNVDGTNNNTNKRGRNRSIFSTPMLNKQNKARSSPALVLNNSSFNSAKTSQKSALSIGSDSSSGGESSRKIPSFMRSLKGNSTNNSLKNNKILPVSQSSSSKNNSASQQPSPKNTNNLLMNKDFGFIDGVSSNHHIPVGAVNNYYYCSSNNSRDSNDHPSQHQQQQHQQHQQQHQQYSSNLPSPGGTAACGGFLSPNMTGRRSNNSIRSTYDSNNNNSTGFGAPNNINNFIYHSTSSYANEPRDDEGESKSRDTGSANDTSNSAAAGEGFVGGSMFARITNRVLSAASNVSGGGSRGGGGGSKPNTARNSRVLQSQTAYVPLASLQPPSSQQLNSSGGEIDPSADMVTVLWDIEQGGAGVGSDAVDDNQQSLQSPHKIDGLNKKSVIPVPVPQLDLNTVDSSGVTVCADDRSFLSVTAGGGSDKVIGVGAKRDSFHNQLVLTNIEEACDV